MGCSETLSFSGPLVVFFQEPHSERDDTPISSPNIPFLCNAEFSFSVRGDNVLWPHSSNIPKYTIAQACLIVQGFVFIQEFPRWALIRRWFPPSQTACASYCLLYYISGIALQQLLSKMSLVMWICWQIGIVCVHLCAWQWVTPPGLLS